MKALDLFCGAGGASKGLFLAGFTDIVGVDLSPQKSYPYSFIQGDALEFPLGGFDFIWASPPCQAFTAYRRTGRVGEYPDLISLVRKKMPPDIPWCIENVCGAPLQDSIQLCGSSFGLDIRRHRVFETNFKVPGLPCSHGWQEPRFPPASNRKNLRRTVEVGVWRIPLPIQQKAMGISWMTREELSQAVPPAYAEYIVRWT